MIVSLFLGSQARYRDSTASAEALLLCPMLCLCLGGLWGCLPCHCFREHAAEACTREYLCHVIMCTLLTVSSSERTAMCRCKVHRTHAKYQHPHIADLPSSNSKVCSVQHSVDQCPCTAHACVLNGRDVRRFVWKLTAHRECRGSWWSTHCGAVSMGSSARLHA